MRSVKELAERRFQQKEEGAKALTDYQAKEQATRLLTAKLRAERLARESKPHRKRSEAARQTIQASAIIVGAIITSMMTTTKADKAPS